jgi:hypothetical protein
MIRGTSRSVFRGRRPSKALAPDCGTRSCRGSPERSARSHRDRGSKSALSCARDARLQRKARRVVEGLARCLSQRRVLIGNPGLVEIVFHRQNGLLGRFEHRIEAAQNRHRQDHVAIFAAHVEIAKGIIGDAPDEVRDPVQVSIVHAFDFPLAYRRLFSVRCLKSRLDFCAEVSGLRKASESIATFGDCGSLACCDESCPTVTASREKTWVFLGGHGLRPRDHKHKVPMGAGWIHELKYDGYRISRHRPAPVPQRDQLGERVSDDRGCHPSPPGGQIALDGEAVCLRPDGRPDLHALRSRQAGCEARLMAFDLLGLGGRL